MNRVYLMPKVLIVTLIITFLTKLTNWYYLLLWLFIAMVLVAIYELLHLYLLGRYYYSRSQKGKPIDGDKMYSIVHRYMKMVNNLFRVNIKVFGYDNMDPNKNYLITPNHQSNEDALVVMEAFKDHIAFVSKYSMSEVILVKDWMHLIGCLFLKKDDMRSQIIIMNEVAQKLKEGYNMVIFPEGRRSFSSDLNEFKSGTFKMATKTKVDILPVTMNHVHKFRHHFPWRRTDINVHIHPSIPYETYKDLSTGEIADLVKSVIASKIEKE